MAKSALLDNPQISRTNYRNAVFAVFVIVVIFPFAAALKSAPDKRIITALKNPRDPQSYLTIGERYESHNAFTLALTQYALANQLDKATGSADILRIEMKEKARENIQESLKKWQAFVLDHPNYRDGWLVIAAYNYQLGSKTEAKQAIDQALKLDGTYEPSKQLARLIEQ